MQQPQLNETCDICPLGFCALSSYNALPFCADDPDTSAGAMSVVKDLEISPEERPAEQHRTATRVVQRNKFKNHDAQ